MRIKTEHARMGARLGRLLPQGRKNELKRSLRL